MHCIITIFTKKHTIGLVEKLQFKLNVRHGVCFPLEKRGGAKKQKNAKKSFLQFFLYFQKNSFNNRKSFTKIREDKNLKC